MSQSQHYGDFFSGFDVSYDDDKPEGSLNEINGQSADINKGFGGTYVWVTPRKATDASKIVDNIWIDLTDDADPDRSDLAKGAGGHYRYVCLSNNMSAEFYITDIALWRCSDRQERPPAGWEHMSQDINQGRGGDYLHFVWKTKRYIGQKP